MKMCACSFIDKYIKCNIPDDEELSQLVSKVQKHRHSATCRRHGKCRFHYPRPPSPETVIARQSTAATYPQEQAEQAVKALAAVQKILDDKDTPEDISMDELLHKAEVISDMYVPMRTEDLLHRKQCCHAEKTIRVLDQHLQSRYHQGVESQHGPTIHPRSICMCDVHSCVHAQE